MPSPYTKVKCPKCKGRFWDILQTTMGNSKIECHECHHIYMTSKSEEQIQKDIELRKQAEQDYIIQKGIERDKLKALENNPVTITEGSVLK